MTEDNDSQETDPDILVCVPCYNAEETIVECVRPFLGRKDTRILLVDDRSARPLQDFIKQHTDADWSDVTLVRPDKKVYAEGARNLGIHQALDGGYRILVFVDSDIIATDKFLTEIQAFFQANADEVVVSATIQPYGSLVQYAETLINFSRYLPRTRPELCRTQHLASYAFALNLDRFRENPCLFEGSQDDRGVWWSAEDILFFNSIKSHFAVTDFPILNHVSVLHKHPRNNLRRALKSQQRYARAMLRSGHSRYLLPNAIPLLHLLTPRFWLMVFRLLRRKRVGDFRYLPVCWLLDFCRSAYMIRLLWDSRRMRKRAPAAARNAR